MNKQQKIEQAAELVEKKEEVERLLGEKFFAAYNSFVSYKKVYDTDLNEQVDSLVKNHLQKKLRSLRAKIGRIKM